MNLKFVRFASAAVLAATLLTISAQAFATESVTNHDTEGKVLFVPNDSEATVVQPPNPGPNGPDVEIDPVGPEGQTGPLTIAYAPALNFGEQVISNTDQEYKLVAELHKLKDAEDSEERVPYVSFAQVQDTRGTNAGWDLKVSLSAFESGTQNNELTGARIRFNSPKLEYNGSNQENEPQIHADGLILDATNSERSVLTAAQTKGAGVSSVVWGDQEEINRQVEAGAEVVENAGIELLVPGSTAKDAALYEATLTWTLAATAGPDGETVQ